MVCRSHQTLKFFFRQNWKLLSKGRLESKTVIASVAGTETDPQGYSRQV
jgi:hypothetical protein